MAREEIVRETLGLGETDLLNERGVYHAPENEGEALPEEWLDDQALAERFVSADRLSAALGRGSAKRLVIEPRVIVLEGIDEPTLKAGAVGRARGGGWIIDTRNAPAAIAVSAGDHEVLIWGEGGHVRLFELRRSARH